MSTATIEAYTGAPEGAPTLAEMIAWVASYMAMPLTSIQKGAIGQLAFLTIALATGKGELEAYAPVADNEGRDAEVRRHMKSKPGISIQIKVAFYLPRYLRRRYLRILVHMPFGRVKSDPRLWYFFAAYDLKELRFLEPCYLVPADVFYKIGREGKPTKRQIYFAITANLTSKARDKWKKYRIALKDLGPRLLEIVDDAALTSSARQVKLAPDAVWLTRALRAKVKLLRTARTGVKYDLIRDAVLGRDSVSAMYQGHLRLFSPVLLGTKRGEPHVLGYQFGGTSEKPLGPEGDSKNWRCLRVAGLTNVKLLPGTWHTVPKGKGIQHCIDQVDVRSDSALPATRVLRRAA